MLLIEGTLIYKLELLKRLIIFNVQSNVYLFRYKKKKTQFACEEAIAERSQYSLLFFFLFNFIKETIYFAINFFFDIYMSVKMVVVFKVFFN